MDLDKIREITSKNCSLLETIDYYNYKVAKTDIEDSRIEYKRLISECYKELAEINSYILGGKCEG